MIILVVIILIVIILIVIVLVLVLVLIVLIVVLIVLVLIVVLILVLHLLSNSFFIRLHPQYAQQETFLYVKVIGFIPWDRIPRIDSEI